MNGRVARVGGILVSIRMFMLYQSTRSSLTQQGSCVKYVVFSFQVVIQAESSMAPGILFFNAVYSQVVASRMWKEHVQSFSSELT